MLGKADLKSRRWEGSGQDIPMRSRLKGIMMCLRLDSFYVMEEFIKKGKRSLGYEHGKNIYSWCGLGGLTKIVLCLK